MNGQENRLDRLVERDLVPDDVVAVCIVGSIARGWANPQSDVDVVVVAGSSWSSESSASLPVPLNPGRVSSESLYIDDRRWEVVYWLPQHIDQILGKVSWEEFERDASRGALISPREEILLARLQHCVVLTGEEWVDNMRCRVAESAFQALAVTRSLSASDDAVEDALGQLEGEDFESAVLSARRALGYSVDALLESHGEYLSSIPKWRPQRFRAADPALLSFDRYWELETMRTYDPHEPSRWVTEVLGVCQEIALRVETQP